MPQDEIPTGLTLTAAPWESRAQIAAVSEAEIRTIETELARAIPEFPLNTYLILQEFKHFRQFVLQRLQYAHQQQLLLHQSHPTRPQVEGWASGVHATEAVAASVLMQDAAAMLTALIHVGQSIDPELAEAAIGLARQARGR